jgi:hypothetical protein
VHTYAKAAVIIAVVFGISGAWGARILSRPKDLFGDGFCGLAGTF